MPVPSRAVLTKTVAAGAIGAFLVSYVAFAFLTVWGGDIFIYVAAVSEIYRDFPHLLHEATTETARASFVLTPYMLLIGLFGRAVGFSPYEALQWAGAANVALFVAAVLYFFRSRKDRMQPLYGCAFFLVICIFMRGRDYAWSSELSFDTLALIQAYPSFMAWSAALVCFGLTDRFLEAGDIRRLFAVATLVWISVLSHPLTGSWIVLIIASRVLAELLRSAAEAGWRVEVSSPAPRRVFLVGVAIVVALAASFLWPYSSLLVDAGFVSVREMPSFAGRPFSSFPLLYLTAIPALFYAARREPGMAAFTVTGFLVTYAAYLILRDVSDFFERYIFFMAFFAQVVVAAALADVTARWSSPGQALPGIRGGNAAAASVGRFLLPLVLIALAVSFFGRRSDIHLHRTLDARADFEARNPILRAALRSSDIMAACPVNYLSMYLFSMTGARFVLALSSYVGPTAARRADLAVLFGGNSSQESADAVLEQYGITKALIGPGCSPSPSFAGRLVQLAQENGWTVFSVSDRSGARR